MLRDLDQQMEIGQMMVSTLWIKLYSEYEYEIRYHPGKENVVTDALSRKERVKSRRVRAMAMTIQYGVRGMILTTQSEAFKQENVPLVGSEMDEAHASRYLVHPGADKKLLTFKRHVLVALNREGLCFYVNKVVLDSLRDNSKEWNSSDDQLRLRWMIYLVVLADVAESVRDTIGFEYCLASSSGWTKSPVLWAEIRESSLTGPELVLDTTDKVVLTKEKLKAARDRIIRFGKKVKLALRYVRPFEILERISPVAYRLRLPKELSGVHDTFQVSNLKKCLADASLYVPLDEIKVDKTLCFVEEPVEIMDREVKSLKHSGILLVKVHWNLKRGPEFTWESEDHMKYKYPLDICEESFS
ncbi:hypothetical protein Tco_1012186 [Tanacetum coccineum]